MFQLILALTLGKAIYHVSRILNIGGGSAAPGYYALKVYPNLVKDLITQIPQNIIITGTNGKTTTSRLLNHLVKSQNLKTLRNSAGSNLERGIASSLISKSNFFGQTKNIDLGIWEVDEAAFNTVLFKLKPQIIVFLNAFRDQLDRYGEVDTIVKRWWESLSKVNWDPTILVNGSDPNTAYLADIENIKSYEFKIKGHTLYKEASFKSRSKESNYLIVAEVTENLGLKGSEFKIKFNGSELKIKFPVPGIYHIYDFLASFGVYYLLNLPFDEINKKLENFSPAFGRVEKLNIKGTESYIFLIKNPAGTMAVLDTIREEITTKDKLLVALNDNFADGTDVSWIWDVEWEKLKIKSEKIKVICSGTRAEDMALRLKYAGVNTQNLFIEPGLENALLNSLKDLEGRSFILPTYTALLELQKIFAKIGVKKHYWKEEA